MKDLSIGINPICWSNDDLLEVGGDIPLETCLSEAREAGYVGIELGNKFPRTPDKLAETLSPYGLNFISGWYSTKLLERSLEAEIEAVQSHLTLLKGMGCKVMIVAEVTDCVHGDVTKPLSQRPVISENKIKDLAQSLTKFGAYLESQGLKMAYHHHMGTVIETLQEIETMMDAAGPELGLLLDTGHLTFAGGDPMQIIEKYGDRITHFHCKDIRADILTAVKNKDSSFLNAVLEGVFTVPGDGCVDFQTAIEKVVATGYRDWFVVEAEQDPNIAPPLPYVTKGYKHLDAIIEPLRTHH